MAKNPKTAFDSWLWIVERPSETEYDALNAYDQFGPGKALLDMATDRKAELMEALFPLRTSHHTQCMSGPELEYSYGLHLKEIIYRPGFRSINGITSFMDNDVTLVIIEIGRFFTELESSCRPRNFYSGHIPEAAGPLIGVSWPVEIRKQYTLNELHRRCHSKNLLKDWLSQRVQRFTFSGKTCAKLSDREAELTYILEMLLSIRERDQHTSNLLANVGEKECNQFIIDFLDNFLPRQSEESLEQAGDPIFKPSDLNLSALESLGGLGIVWTDRIDDHLHLSPSSRTLKIFWDISLLDQSPLFWSNAQCLSNPR